MKTLSESQIKRSISNVKATLAVEGIVMGRRAIVNGRRFLKGQLSSEEVIGDITAYIQRKNRN
ncbi:MAG: hypothetical protein WA118_03435 [Carboxydocellales bacterium]